MDPGSTNYLHQEVTNKLQTESSHNSETQEPSEMDLGRLNSLKINESQFKKPDSDELNMSNLSLDDMEVKLEDNPPDMFEKLADDLETTQIKCKYDHMIEFYHDELFVSSNQYSSERIFNQEFESYNKFNYVPMLKEMFFDAIKNPNNFKEERQNKHKRNILQKKTKYSVLELNSPIYKQQQEKSRLELNKTVDSKQFETELNCKMQDANTNESQSDSQVEMCRLEPEILNSAQLNSNVPDSLSSTQPEINEVTQHVPNSEHRIKSKVLEPDSLTNKQLEINEVKQHTLKNLPAIKSEVSPDKITCTQEQTNCTSPPKFESKLNLGARKEAKSSEPTTPLQLRSIFNSDKRNKSESYDPTSPLKHISKFTPDKRKEAQLSEPTSPPKLVSKLNPDKRKEAKLSESTTPSKVTSMLNSNKINKSEPSEPTSPLKLGSKLNLYGRKEAKLSEPTTPSKLMSDKINKSESSEPTSPLKLGSKLNPDGRKEAKLSEPTTLSERSSDKRNRSESPEPTTPPILVSKLDYDRRKAQLSEPISPPKLRSKLNTDISNEGKLSVPINPPNLRSKLTPDKRKEAQLSEPTIPLKLGSKLNLDERKEVNLSEPTTPSKHTSDKRNKSEPSKPTSPLKVGSKLNLDERKEAKLSEPTTPSKRNSDKRNKSESSEPTSPPKFVNKLNLDKRKEAKLSEPTPSKIESMLNSNKRNKSEPSEPTSPLKLGSKLNPDGRKEAKLSEPTTLSERSSDKRNRSESPEPTTPPILVSKVDYYRRKAQLSESISPPKSGSKLNLHERKEAKWSEPTTPSKLSSDKRNKSEPCEPTCPPKLGIMLDYDRKEAKLSEPTSPPKLVSNCTKQEIHESRPAETSCPELKIDNMKIKTKKSQQPAITEFVPGSQIYRKNIDIESERKKSGISIIQTDRQHCTEQMKTSEIEPTKTKYAQREQTGGLQHGKTNGAQKEHTVEMDSKGKKSATNNVQTDIRMYSEQLKTCYIEPTSPNYLQQDPSTGKSHPEKNVVKRETTSSLQLKISNPAQQDATSTSQPEITNYAQASKMNDSRTNRQSHPQQIITQKHEPNRPNDSQHKVNKVKLATTLYKKLCEDMENEKEKETSIANRKTSKYDPEQNVGKKFEGSGQNKKFEDFSSVKETFMLVLGLDFQDKNKSVNSFSDHGQEILYACCYCKNVFDDKDHLIFHLASHKFIRNTRNSVLKPLVKEILERFQNTSSSNVGADENHNAKVKIFNDSKASETINESEQVKEDNNMKTLNRMHSSIHENVDHKHHKESEITALENCSIEDSSSKRARDTLKNVSDFNSKDLCRHNDKKKQETRTEEIVKATSSNVRTRKTSQSKKDKTINITTENNVLENHRELAPSSDMNDNNSKIFKAHQDTYAQQEETRELELETNDKEQLQTTAFQPAMYHSSHQEKKIEFTNQGTNHIEKNNCAHNNSKVIKVKLAPRLYKKLCEDLENEKDKETSTANETTGNMSKYDHEQNVEKQIKGSELKKDIEDFSSVKETFILALGLDFQDKNESINSLNQGQEISYACGYCENEFDGKDPLIFHLASHKFIRNTRNPVLKPLVKDILERSQNTSSSNAGDDKNQNANLKLLNVSKVSETINESEQGKEDNIIKTLNGVYSSIRENVDERPHKESEITALENCPTENSSSKRVKNTLRQKEQESRTEKIVETTNSYCRKRKVLQSKKDRTINITTENNVLENYREHAACPDINDENSKIFQDKGTPNSVSVGDEINTSITSSKLRLPKKNKRKRERNVNTEDTCNRCYKEKLPRTEEILEEKGTDMVGMNRTQSGKVKNSKKSVTDKIKYLKNLKKESKKQNKKTNKNTTEISSAIEASFSSLHLDATSKEKKSQFRQILAQNFSSSSLEISNDKNHIANDSKASENNQLENYTEPAANSSINNDNSKTLEVSPNRVLGKEIKSAINSSKLSLPNKNKRKRQSKVNLINVPELNTEDLCKHNYEEKQLSTEEVLEEKVTNMVGINSNQSRKAKNSRSVTDKIKYLKKLKKESKNQNNKTNNNSTQILSPTEASFNSVHYDETSKEKDSQFCPIFTQNVSSSSLEMYNDINHIANDSNASENNQLDNYTEPAVNSSMNNDNSKMLEVSPNRVLGKEIKSAINYSKLSLPNKNKRKRQSKVNLINVPELNTEDLCKPNYEEKQPPTAEVFKEKGTNVIRINRTESRRIVTARRSVTAKIKQSNNCKIGVINNNAIEGNSGDNSRIIEDKGSPDGILETGQINSTIGPRKRRLSKTKKLNNTTFLDVRTKSIKDLRKVNNKEAQPQTGEELGTNEVRISKKQPKRTKTGSLEKDCTKSNVAPQNVNNVVGTEEDTFICNNCGRILKSKYMLISHLKTHSEKSSLTAKNTKDMKFKCKTCKSKFATQSELLNHEVKAHDCDKSYRACTICEYKTPYTSRLTAHMRAHNNIKPFECAFCKKEFRTRNELKRHVRIHTGETPYQCEFCLLKFSTRPTNYHLKTHSGERPYQCVYCAADFKSVSALKHHLNTHADERPFKCSNCTSSFRDTSALEEHMLSHKGEKPYKCYRCEYSSASRHGLQKHAKTHKIEASDVAKKKSLLAERPHKCTICTASFTLLSHLKRHLNIHLKEKCYKCTTCSSSFSDGSSLKRHMRCHTGEKSYRCNQCEYTTANNFDLTRHAKLHLKTPYQCEFCLLKFSRRPTLNRHLKTHSGERPYQCVYCAADFKFISALIHHLNTHADERPFKCSNCTSSFRDTSALEEHMLSHEGEKPYKCYRCEYSSASRHGLQRHAKTHEIEASDVAKKKSLLAERPHKCTVCTASFTLLSHLRRHLNIHFKEKCYKCTTCSSSFSDGSALKRHMRCHTGEKSYRCNQCEYTTAYNFDLTKHAKLHLKTNNKK